MKVLINAQPHELPSGATVQEALAAIGACPPFAVAVNTAFVPRGSYASCTLHEGDRIEVISPVTGG